MSGSLSSGRKLVILILTGAIMPDDELRALQQASRRMLIPLPDQL